MSADANCQARWKKVSPCHSSRTLWSASVVHWPRSAPTWTIPITYCEHLRALSSICIELTYSRFVLTRQLKVLDLGLGLAGPRLPLGSLAHDHHSWGGPGGLFCDVPRRCKHNRRSCVFGMPAQLIMPAQSKDQMCLGPFCLTEAWKLRCTRTCCRQMPCKAGLWLFTAGTRHFGLAIDPRP